jgi:hypothetical protein
MKGKILAAALVAGVLAGAAGAAVRAEEHAAPLPVESAKPFGHLPDGRYDARYTHYRVLKQRIAVRANDPAGGPAWAVKVFDADRVKLERSARSLTGAKVIGRDRCVQLGRVQGDDFGWVFGDGRFRRVETEEQLMQCMPRQWRKPMAQFTSALAITDPAAPKLTAGVVWGWLEDAPSVTVSGTEGADGPAPSSGGVFLRVAGPRARPLAAARAQGGGQTVELEAGGVPEHLAGRFPTIVAGTERVEAPAPDPMGGPRYGVAVAETREGVPCVAGATHVVEGRSGSADLRLGRFAESVLTDVQCRPLTAKPTAERPCDWTTGFTAMPAEADDAFLRGARNERRVLAGRTTVTAQCSAEVERVTLRTQRDLRTLIPSPVGHAILAVYDGDFVDGDAELIAHLRGGRTWSTGLSFGSF